DPRQVKNQFRTHLYRAEVTTATGYIFAYLHGEFEPISGEYQLHFHGVCADEKLKALEKLRNTQGCMRTNTIFRPIVINHIRDRVRQLSYIVQSFWPEKARILLDHGDIGRRVRTKRRVREPHQTLYLLWLHRQSVNHMCLLNGLRIRGGRIAMA